MDCTWIARDEVFEQYVRDALEPDDRDAFEEHYVGCAACFDKIRTYQALRVELPANLVELPATSQVRTRTWRWAVVPAAAVVLLMSPYLEEAHFYLGKARLRQGDIRAARAELQRTIERRGRLEAAARSLLVQIDVLPEREDRPPGN